MAKDRITEKQFLAYLDRMLAGEDINSFQGISEDVRQDLLFARIMMSNREDPYPVFKEQLKQRLLARMASLSAVDKAPGFWERFRAISQQKLVIGFVSGAAALVLLIAGVYVTVNYIGINVKQAAAPAAVLPANVLPPGNYAINLPQRIAPENLTYSVQTALSASRSQVPVYQVQMPVVTADSVTDLARRLEMKGNAVPMDDGSRFVLTDDSSGSQKELVVWKDTGAVEYGLTDKARLYLKAATPLPSGSSAKKIAYDFLSKANLLASSTGGFSAIENAIAVIPGGAYPAAGQAATASDQAGAAFWTVTIPYLIDGRPATGPGAKMEVTVGGGGQVTKLLWTWRTVKPAFTGNVISPEQAYREFSRGSGSIDIPLNSSRLVVKQVDLGYWIDTYTEKQDYLLPVYKFRGDCLDKNGKLLEEFSGWIPALSR